MEFFRRFSFARNSDIIFFIIFKFPTGLRFPELGLKIHKRNVFSSQFPTGFPFPDSDFYNFITIFSLSTSSTIYQNIILGAQKILFFPWKPTLIRVGIFKLLGESHQQVKHPSSLSQHLWVRTFEIFFRQHSVRNTTCLPPWKSHKTPGCSNHTQ